MTKDIHIKPTKSGWAVVIGEDFELIPRLEFKSKADAVAYARGQSNLLNYPIKVHNLHDSDSHGFFHDATGTST